MKTVQKVLFVAGAVAQCVATVLCVVALALERWIDDSATAYGSVVGDVSATHTIGLFRTQITECCFTAGQLVGDTGSVCNTAPPAAGCSTYSIVTGAYCDYVAQKRNSAAVGSISCGEFEAGTIFGCIVLIAAIASSFACLFGLVTAKLKSGWIAVFNGILAALFVVTLILYKLIVFDNEHEWMMTRYRSNSNLSPSAVNVDLSDSFNLLIATLAFTVAACLFQIGSWLLRPQHVLQSPIQHPPIEHIMTPEVVTANPVARFTHARPVLCPQDLDCEFVDDFGHQLEYVHSCRLPFCTDNSVAHRRRFVH